MNKQSLYMTLLLLLSLSAICHAQRSTQHFVVKLEQNTGSPDKSFSIQQHYQNTLPNNPSIIAKINNYAGSDAPANNIPPRPGGYGLKTGIIESISWNLLYASHLLVAYELTLTTKDTYLNSNIYSWLPFIVVGSLLSSYWNPDSPMFNTIGQQELSQDYPFVINTMTHSFGNNPQQGQPSASSGQQTTGTTTQLAGTHISPLDSGAGDGNGDPEQHRHTYGLNCFVDSCNGVCRFRPPSDSREPAEADEECPICYEKFSDTMVTPCCSQKIDTHCLQRTFQNAPRWSMKTCPLCRANMNLLAQSPDFAVSEEGQQDLPDLYNQPWGFRLAPFVFTGIADSLTCDNVIVGEDGQPRPCGRHCRNRRALAEHVREYHSGQQTCELTVIGENGQQRPCSRIFRSARTLSFHKRIHHRRQ
ncbi:hypothetical protein [Endozoicomonas sp. 8E]|uniref:hypothetical protein n=1 Tax=Endozoicomonas sp. 8E TaxID=3035692 RepID=UPI0029391AE7|nr:hypothetical protein [Endozoicomonas sp. 8E]WOG26910.1 hypothetical protein P6910_20530 [Endozoicomonas sp. 8E]